MKKIITLSMFFMATALFAQEETTEKKVSISGSVDAYFRTNLTTSDVEAPNPGTSFANQTGFALGMANIIASYEGDETGAVADLVFGPRGEGAITGLNINQLYAYWNISDVTKLTVGRFNTYLGYEVISPVSNFNYSTSYLFSNGPFSHTGLKADFELSDDFSLMVAVMNATDVDNNLTGDYALGAQLGYKGQFLNFYYDNDEVLGFEIDYTGGFDISDELYLGVNAAYQTRDTLLDDDDNVLSTDTANGFYGVALYPQYTLSDEFAIGLRGEYFGRHIDVDGIDDVNTLGLTLTGSYSIENLTIKPELRLDNNSEDTTQLPDSDGLASKSLAAFTIAAIYSF